jgi:predicted transcriptional regulator
MNKLVMLVNLNRQLANESVRQLVANGLVEARAEARPVVYSTTTQGLEWLRLFRSLVRGIDILVQGKNELAPRGKKGPQAVVAT